MRNWWEYFYNVGMQRKKGKDLYEDTTTFENVTEEWQ